MTRTVPAASYPVGVRALLPDEARRRRAIETAVVAALEAERFEEIVLPMIDFVDPYEESIDRDLKRRSYRFTDRDGELIAIRSDFTPMVARALAPSLSRADLPLRVFYRGDVIRNEASRLGSAREFFQIGAELIGDSSTGADFAMLALAIRLVTNAGVRPTVVVTDSSLASSLIENSTASLDERRAIRSALANKRVAALDELSASIDTERAALFRRIASGHVTLEDFLAREETATAARNLAALQDRAAELSGANVIIAVDDIDEEPGYYTGIRFRLFEPRSRLRLAQGGRYDRLYSRFGSDASAIGFTVTVDYLTEGR